jgi:hypothetical protein
MPPQGVKMSKLAILVPHYKESEEEIKPLLDSIEH